MMNGKSEGRVEEAGFALLPAAPASICFDKSEFMRDDYRVEQFVSDCRRRVPLEKLRRDLEEYFRLLKTAMVDLINKDYAEFVNLSTNLADLDKAINHLKPPLIKIKGDVELISGEIDNGLEKIQELLEQKQKILARKLLLKHMMGLQEQLEYLEQNDEIKLDKVAEIWNVVRHHQKNAGETVLAKSLAHRVSAMEQRLLERLENNFIEALQEEDNAMLHQILSAYSSITKCDYAENIIRLHLCRPYIHQILEGKSISELPQLFNSLLDFVPTYLGPLQNIISGRTSGLPPISGYDFISRSVFPELVAALQKHLPGLFIPGSSCSEFRKRYELTLDFLTQLEQQCSSQASVQSYRTFQNSFSLESYYQQTSKQIISELEESLKHELRKFSQEKISEEDSPRLFATSGALQALKSCISDEILLPGLLHKFYRLQVQIIYRFAKWASNSISICSDFDSEIDLAGLVDLHQDLHFVSGQVENVLFSKIRDKVSSNDTDIETLKLANKEAQNRILEPTKNIQEHVQSFLVTKCSPAIKSVGDIPRQYRRTNRAPPSEASTYVRLLYSPLAEFSDKCPKMTDWVVNVFESVATDYAKI